jgi:hypothetical protein
MSSLHHDFYPIPISIPIPLIPTPLPHPIPSPSPSHKKKTLQQKQDQLVSKKKITYTKRITDKMCASGPVVHKRKGKIEECRYRSSNHRNTPLLRPGVFLSSSNNRSPPSALGNTGILCACTSGGASIILWPGYGV